MTRTPHQKAAAIAAWRASGECPDGVPLPTLYRWWKDVQHAPRETWPEVLSPRYRGRTVCAEIPPDAWAYFLGTYLALLAPTATECYRRTQEAADRFGWGELPSLKTFLRRVEKDFSPEEITLARRGEEAIDRMLPAQRRTVAKLEPLQEINGDGLTLDIFVQWKDGAIIRPHVWTWQDVYSRMPLAWQIDFSENTCQIRRAFGAVIAKYGVWCGAGSPCITIDNTRAAANKTMTGGTAFRHRYAFKEQEAHGIFKNFGYDVHFTSIDKWGGRGQAKPVERLHREMLEKVCKAPECYGAYTGANPMAKPEDYGKRAVPYDVFMAVFEREMERICTQTGRRTEMAKGEKSQREVFQEGYEHAKRRHHIRTLEAHEHRLYSLARQTVRVGKDVVEVKLANNRYWASELTAYRGQDIVLLHDPDNYHDTQWAYTLDGKLIAPVQHIPDSGYRDAETARTSARLRRDYRKGIKMALQAKTKAAQAHVALHTHLPEPDDTKLTQLPPAAPPPEEEEFDARQAFLNASRRLA